MLMSEKLSYLASFSRVPNNLEEKYSTNGLLLRQFGILKDDLNIDFNQNTRPYLVTQLLQCCTRDNNGETLDNRFFWDMTIGKRIECLLTIATLGSSAKLPIQLRCLHETCQEPMEIDISMEELANLQHRSDNNEPFNIQIGEKKLLIRKPTGNDQLKWLKSSFPNEGTAMNTMIRTLLCDEDKICSYQELSISDEWVKTINDAMEEFDPLINFSIAVYCPCCGKQSYHELNLEELLLQELHKAQLNLFQSIHRLAMHYHWSERQILSIPPWRRSYYLSLIEKEENR
jgi:hypothetical protein